MSIFNYREEPGYFKRLREALRDTKRDLEHRLDQVLGTSESPITETQLEDLEHMLIGADLGLQTTLRLTDQIRERTRGIRLLTSFQVKRMIRKELLSILGPPEGRPQGSAAARPRVIFVVGVNGAGKTTTVGKLACRLKEEGQQVLICASDTFRAAALEQLAVWAERTQTEIIGQQAGADPGAVLFDALGAAKARRTDVLLVDTAGRLHTRTNLMRELEKMKRVAARQVEGAPHEVYLVLDAITGQNGLNQARQFLQSIGVSGLIVTKLDGTAKGGIVLAIAAELQIPILYIGVGERQQDLIPFSAEAFVDSLFDEGG